MYLKRLLRAMCSNLSAGMKIYVTTRQLKPGSVLAQVRVEPPDDRPDLKHLFVFAMSVQATEAEAMDDAMHKALGSVQALTERMRPNSAEVQKRVYQRFSRSLAIQGGMWEEERARGHKRRASELLGRHVKPRLV